MHLYHLEFKISMEHYKTDAYGVFDFRKSFEES